MNLITDIVKDLRFAFRQLRRSPGLTLVVILSLALGIGANTAIFSAIEAVMLRPLPVKDPQQLVMLQWSSHDYPSRFIQGIEGGGGRSLGGGGRLEAQAISQAAFEYLRDHNDVFSSTFAVAGNDIDVNLGFAGRAESALADGVSGAFFDGLGIRPFRGRAIEADDDRDDASAVGVLSFAFWQIRLGRDPSVLGKTITFNGRPLTIVGVAPEGFFGLQPGVMPDVWIPLHTFSAVEADLGNTSNGVPFVHDPQTWWLELAGRIKTGKTEAEARSQVAVLFQQILNQTAADAPDSATPKADIFSIHYGLDDLRSRFSTSLFVLMAVVGLVLLVACGNVAALLLSRASARQREIAVRLSLGASRARLMRQLLTESVLLALVGGAAGILVSRWADFILISLLSSGRSVVHVQVPLDSGVLIFTLVLSVVSGVLFGFAPAIRATSLDVSSGLKQSTGSSGASSFRSGKVVVGAQVALCLVIVTGSGLFLRTLGKLQATDVGFDRDHLLLFTVRPGLNGYKGERLSAYYETLQQRIQTIPGVRAASFASRPPIGMGTGRSSGFIEGYIPPDKAPNFFRHQIGADYFKTLGVPVVIGRPIGIQDSKQAPWVAVINEKLAATYFHGDNPLGHKINFGSVAKPLNYEIVGVVKDVKYSQIRNEAPATVYFSYVQWQSNVPNSMTFEVRTTVDPSSIIENVHREAGAVDGNVPLVDVKSQSDVIDQAVFMERTLAALTTAFGTLALLLACVGLYGAISYTVARRTREIGIRMALGAKRADILWSVARETFVIVLIGLAVGLPVTLAATRVLKDQLYGLTASDPLTVVASVVVIMVVTAIAGYLPALRASSITPVVALKAE